MFNTGSKQNHLERWKREKGTQMNWAENVGWPKPAGWDDHSGEKDEITRGEPPVWGEAAKRLPQWYLKSPTRRRKRIPSCVGGKTGVKG